MMEWTTRGRAAYKRTRAAGVPATPALNWARTLMEAERHEDWPSLTSDYLFVIDGLNVRVEAEVDDVYEPGDEGGECAGHEHVGFVGFVEERCYSSCWGFCDTGDQDGYDCLLTSAYDVACEAVASYQSEQSTLGREANALVLSVL